MTEIVITLKLYSGLEKELKIDDYDENRGIKLTLKPGISLRSVLKKIGLKKSSHYIFFSSGHHISPWKRFNESAEVSCLRISGGG